MNVLQQQLDVPGNLQSKRHMTKRIDASESIWHIVGQVPDHV